MAVTLLGARRFGVGRVAPVAVMPLALAWWSPFEWILLSGLAPAPLIGLLAAVQVERGRSYGQIVAAASLPGGLLALWLLVSLHGESGQDGAIASAVSASLEPLTADADLPDAVSLQELVALSLRLLPGMVYLSLLLVAVLGYRAAQVVAGRGDQPLPEALPLHLWRMWEPMVWGLIGALALLLVGGSVLGGLAVNAVLVLGVLYAVQGLAVLRFAMWRLGVQRFLEVLVYVLLAFTSGLSLPLLALLGLGDTWFDWRRIGHRRDDTSPGNGRAQEIEP